MTATPAVDARETAMEVRGSLRPLDDAPERPRGGGMRSGGDDKGGMLPESTSVAALGSNASDDRPAAATQPAANQTTSS